ncbi:MAG: DUF2480 family protein [Cyclobacteriaceae bacterium]
MDEIVNRVAKSPLVSVDLEEYIHKGEKCLFDLKDHLFEGLILKEKDFRDFIKSNDWSEYDGKNVGLICSADAIVPIWAYMLLASSLNTHAHLVVFGDEQDIEKALIGQAIDGCIKSQDLQGAKVVIKGCGEVQNKEYAYTQITNALLPIVTSIMYGEPCSTVPIFKKRK